MHAKQARTRRALRGFFTFLFSGLTHLSRTDIHRSASGAPAWFDSSGCICSTPFLFLKYQEYFSIFAFSLRRWNMTLGNKIPSQRLGEIRKFFVFLPFQFKILKMLPLRFFFFWRTFQFRFSFKCWISNFIQKANKNIIQIKSSEDENYNYFQF